jgi:hypothetical protein
LADEIQAKEKGLTIINKESGAFKKAPDSFKVCFTW